MLLTRHATIFLRINYHKKIEELPSGAKHPTGSSDFMK